MADSPKATVLRAKWWTGEDSNLRSPQGAADLQSAGFSHSPTRPHGKPPRDRARSLCPRRDTHSSVLFTQETVCLFLSEFRRPTPLRSQKISWRRDLNPRPSDYKSDALPTELRQRSSNQKKITKGQLNCKGLSCREQFRCPDELFWSFHCTTRQLAWQTGSRRGGPRCRTQLKRTNGCL
jgi:hypothetical protein